MTHTRLHASLALAACLATGPVAAGETETFALDPVHTRVLFRVDHAGFSRALGTFSGATGELAFDPDDWRGARLEVELPLASLDLGDADWNRRVLGRGFLDAGRHPVARFRSTRVEPTGPDGALVHGELELRGQRRPMVLDVRLNALERHPITFRRTAGFSASARLDRRDFGMVSWPNVVGHEVELWIEAEAIRARGTGEPAGPGPARPAGAGPGADAGMPDHPDTDTDTEPGDADQKPS
ncbi:YceI family protein [Arenimonas fontis]|uniref:Polyisoprenoid-binding protein n=1 Tax=Arenimonas fontis TaxID=2608255 RepID=A0A5B2ZD93_9GAMM|nr:YceI family protein [Arenimonas fontis]KAA2285180.1 polyisoprenoid-binding protein [Arenimonas fontis]